MKWEMTRTFYSDLVQKIGSSIHRSDAEISFIVVLKYEIVYFTKRLLTDTYHLLADTMVLSLVVAPA